MTGFTVFLNCHPPCFDCCSVERPAPALEAVSSVSLAAVSGCLIAVSYFPAPSTYSGIHRVVIWLSQGLPSLVGFWTVNCC